MFFSQLSQLADTGLGRLQQIKNDFEAHVESQLGLDHVNAVLGTDAGTALCHPVTKTVQVQAMLAELGSTCAAWYHLRLLNGDIDAGHLGYGTNPQGGRSRVWKAWDAAWH